MQGVFPIRGKRATAGNDPNNTSCDSGENLIQIRFI